MLFFLLSFDFLFLLQLLQIPLHQSGTGFDSFT